MNVHFTARQTDLTPEVRQYCEKRLKALEKLLGSVLEVDIILSVARTRNRAEIHVKDKKAGLVVVEETPDMMNSLNLVFDGLETKIRKEREKFRERKRRKGRERKGFALPAEAEEPERRILRSPDYSLKPMSVEEAALQLDMRNREVFVFRKEGSEKWAVLFRRKDGNVGLVEPE
ncbi:MAG TPA: ribosome-associated translation inhibitor RaiA [Acidobacteriota bacterium]|nr:ribosome-associated translation inhibitor RaiA [Acidobacteriota bacterium]